MSTDIQKICNILLENIFRYNNNQKLGSHIEKRIFPKLFLEVENSLENLHDGNIVWIVMSQNVARTAFSWKINII
jgi:hypothetical protein